MNGVIDLSDDDGDCFSEVDDSAGQVADDLAEVMNLADGVGDALGGVGVFVDGVV